jgi:hypothetical protein
LAFRMSAEGAIHAAVPHLQRSSHKQLSSRPDGWAY